jgi:NAD(P)-dependent dehydrogenase (short-subunit alcohol dehydrogenase family)
MTNNIDLKGQVAVITGAGRGFGLAFARGLAEHGALPIITDINEELGRVSAQKLNDEGLAAEFLPLDVTDHNAVESVAQQVWKEHDRLDLWINNAGLALHGPSETLPIEHWQLGLNIMLSGVFYGCQSAARLMIEQGGGKIINVASVNAFVSQAGRAAYCSAKAGVVSLTEVLGAEWARYNIQVNAVAPAVFLTELAKASIADGSASLDSYLARSPMGRFGDVPELVETILFLASDQSSYITGQTLRVDGGWVSDHYL